MEGKPVQIVSFEKKTQNENSINIYNLDTEALTEILDKIKDLEIVVISIAGQSRKGKSFFMSYLLRYLFDYNNVNWITDSDEPLKGFKWKSGVEAETQGIWMWSKPIIINHSVGKKVAILLMDTQGVYDENTDMRDWSTIVGITLLTSSCFIFNVFNDIQEDVLAQLETFVNYGKMAVKKNGSNGPVFQKLLFLIRDWSTPTKYKYGSSGGKNYLKYKLSIKDNQSEPSKRTRKLISECFEDILCYLMPDLGADKEDDNFDGSIAKISVRFREKLKELFFDYLNPEELDIKLINGKAITGRELLNFFESYVDKFNSKKFPKPLDLVQATEKANDLNLVIKLKESYIYSFHTEMVSKEFLSKNEIEILYNNLCEETKDQFNKSKISKNSQIETEISEMLDFELNTTYKKFYDENQNKKENIAVETVKECINSYRKSINDFIKTNYVKPEKLDDFLDAQKNSAKKLFAVKFVNEDKDFLNNYLLKIIETLDEEEKLFKTQNLKRKAEIRNLNSEAVKESLDYYCLNIKTKLNEKSFMTADQFQNFEQNIYKKSMKLFSEKCKQTGQIFIKFEEEIKTLLDKKKYEFNALYVNYLKEVINGAETESINFIQLYNEKMKKILECLYSREEFDKNNYELKQKIITLFEQKCVVKDPNFLNPYIKKLMNEIDKTSTQMIIKYEKENENLRVFYNKTANEAAIKCFEDPKRLFGGKNLLSDEKIFKFKQDLIDEVIHYYENIAKQDKLNEIKDFIYEKTAQTSDQLMIERLTNNYNETLSQILNTKDFFSRKELKDIHNEKKDNAIKIFNANKKTIKTEKTTEFSNVLIDGLEMNYNSFYNENERKREIIVNEANEKCSIFYCQNITERLNQYCMESSSFENISSQLKSNALKQFQDVCYKESELYGNYYGQISEILNNSENGFRNDNNAQLSEAIKKNSQSVVDSVNFYNQNMDSFIANTNVITIEAFNERQNQIKHQTMKAFQNSTLFGEIEFITRYETQLKQKIKNLKADYKRNFTKRVNAIKTETIKQMDNAIEHYSDFIYLSSKSASSEIDFKENHETYKRKAINQFKKNCQIEDEVYISEQISKLEQQIDNVFKELLEKLAYRLSKPKNNYKRAVSKFFNKYIKLMEDYFEGKDFIPNDELEVYHSQHKETVISEYDLLFDEENDVKTIEEHKDSLQMKIDNEFEKIKSNNRSKADTIKNLKLELEIEVIKFSKEYEERLEEKIISCSNENELLKEHSIIENKIKEEFSKINPFNNYDLFQPFMKKLGIEINKSLDDSKAILKSNLDNHTLEMQIVIRDARKHYRQEMNKFFQNNDFLKAEYLTNCNRIVTEQTIDKYKNQIKRVSLENFKNMIKDSVKDIYEEIIEINNMNTPTTDIAIGIDLGTTNSCVAYYKPSKPKGEVIIINNDMGFKTTPSVVAFNEISGEEIIGNAAKDHAYSRPRNTIFSAKRLIGRKFSDPIVQKDLTLWPFKVVNDGKDMPMIEIKTNYKTENLTPEHISGKLLKTLKETAEKHLGREVKKAVITVPAYFNDSQKEATKHAGKIAGLNVLKIINEPTAAAIAFQMNRGEDKDSKNVLIYDFGGGTFDVVVLSIVNGEIVIKSVGGDNHLGGEDVDHNLVEHCLKIFCDSNKIIFERNSEEGEKALRRLTMNCERHKLELSATHSVTIAVDNFYDRKDLSVEMTRTKFDEINKEIFIKSINLVEKALVDAKLKHEDINDVVLVGGTTRIPKIQEMLSENFFGKTLNHSVNPDEAVAMGAAIQAAILNGAQAQDWKHLKLTDVAPMSLGIDVEDGLMSVIIPRNSKVPNKKTKPYCTVYNNQTEVIIDIYEGEQKMAADNRKLGTITMSNIPRGPAGEQKIEVTFEINDEGILHVTAKLVSSGKEQSIQITEHKGRLTEEQLKAIIEKENKKTTRNKWFFNK